MSKSTDHLRNAAKTIFTTAETEFCSFYENFQGSKEHKLLKMAPSPSERARVHDPSHSEAVKLEKSKNCPPLYPWKYITPPVVVPKAAVAVIIGQGLGSTK